MTPNSKEKNFIVYFIKDLGFPVFLTLILLYNTWNLQNFLIQKLNQTDEITKKLTETLNVNTQTLIEIKRDLEKLEKNRNER
jgi:hypothetical protein